MPGTASSRPKIQYRKINQSGDHRKQKGREAAGSTAASSRPENGKRKSNGTDRPKDPAQSLFGQLYNHTVPMIEQAAWTGRKERNPIDNNNSNSNNGKTHMIWGLWCWKHRSISDTNENPARPARCIHMTYDSSKKNYEYVRDTVRNRLISTPLPNWFALKMSRQHIFPIKFSTYLTEINQKISIFPIINLRIDRATIFN